MIEIVTADHAGIHFQIDIAATYEYLGHTFQTNDRKQQCTARMKTRC